MVTTLRKKRRQTISDTRVGAQRSTGVHGDQTDPIIRRSLPRTTFSQPHRSVRISALARTANPVTQVRLRRAADRLARALQVRSRGPDRYARQGSLVVAMPRKQ